jgi:hypothetical protein
MLRYENTVRKLESRRRRLLPCSFIHSKRRYYSGSLIVIVRIRSSKIIEDTFALGSAAGACERLGKVKAAVDPD